MCTRCLVESLIQEVVAIMKNNYILPTGSSEFRLQQLHTYWDQKQGCDLSPLLSLLPLGLSYTEGRITCFCVCWGLGLLISQTLIRVPLGYSSNFSFLNFASYFLQILLLIIIFGKIIITL